MPLSYRAGWNSVSAREAPAVPSTAMPSAAALIPVVVAASAPQAPVAVATPAPTSSTAAASDAYSSVTSNDFPLDTSDLSGTPRGTRFDENDIASVKRRCPRLAARFR
jgi:hypothetical protein